MYWIYLSPHLDDVALSCGGLIWEQTQRGDRVEVWTVCAGDSPSGDLSPFARSLHARWENPQNAPHLRREEDRRACAILGAAPVHLDIPDCIYRLSGTDGTALYDTEDSLFGELHPEEEPRLEYLADLLDGLLPIGARLVSPMAVGGHVDHRLTREAVARLRVGSWYYADYPYLLGTSGPDSVQQGDSRIEELRATTYPVTKAGLAAWTAAVGAYRSQISTFWADEAEMQDAIRHYCKAVGGVQLWGPGNLA